VIAGLFSNLAGVFKGFFSRAFWFASFMPVAMAVALHLTVAAIAFPHAVPMGRWLRAATSDNLAIFPLVSAGVIVLAYAMGPLAPVALGILDGSRLPPAVQELLRRKRMRMALTAWDDITPAEGVLSALAGMLSVEVQAMIDARGQGAQRPDAADPQLAGQAVAQARAVADCYAHGKLPKVEAMQGALDAMKAALASGRTPDVLSDAQAGLVTTLQRAVREADFQVTQKTQRYGPLATLAPPMATRMAQARATAEAYSLNVYGVKFDFIWPRLWLVLTDKDGASDNVSDAQSQVDFSVMSVCLSATVPLVWLPVLAATATAPWLFLAVAAGGPLACAFFYELAVASQWRLAQVIKATIDRYRLDLLKVLLQPMPATRFAEKQLWSDLQVDEDSSGARDVAYRYAAS
jgi:hypothetical protein